VKNIDKQWTISLFHHKAFLSKYMYFVCHAIFYKASFILSQYTPRCVPAVCSRRTGANRNESWIRVRSYIPGSATKQIRFGAKGDHGMSWLCYGLRQFITGVAPEALRCVPVRPDTPPLGPGHQRQSPAVTTASPGSKTANPRCGTVAYAYQWNFCELIIDMSFAKYRTQVTYQGNKEQHSSGRKGR